MTAALLLLTLLAPSARALEEKECPSGMHRGATNNPYVPFECVSDASKKGFGAVIGPQGFKTRPKCPRGTRAAVTTDGLQKYHCVRVENGEADPDLTPATNDPDAPEAGASNSGGTAFRAPVGGCPEGTRAVRTSDRANPFQCVPLDARPRALGPDAYRRYSVPAEMSFDYPKALQPRDGWKEEVPTLSFTLDEGSPGKPVMLTITKVHPSQPTYIDLESAAAKDKEWLNAKDGGSVPVAGVKARVTFVSGESKTAYIPLGAGAYYTVVYSAPVESYDLYLASFDRLLKTMKLIRGGGR